MVFKAVYLRKLACHFLSILAHILSVFLFVIWLFYLQFYASNYGFQECLKIIFNEDIFIL